MARNDGVNRTTVRNQGMSKALGYDIWHYHLHVVYNTQRVQRNLGCCYSNGEVPNGICCVKNLPRAVYSWQQKSYFISLYA